MLRSWISYHLWLYPLESHVIRRHQVPVPVVANVPMLPLELSRAGLVELAHTVGRGCLTEVLLLRRERRHTDIAHREMRRAHELSTLALVLIGCLLLTVALCLDALEMVWCGLRSVSDIEVISSQEFLEALVCLRSCRTLLLICCAVL